MKPADRLLLLSKLQSPSLLFHTANLSLRNAQPCACAGICQGIDLTPPFCGCHSGGRKGRVAGPELKTETIFTRPRNRHDKQGA